MPKYEKEAAIGVIGLAGFQLVQLWNANAPSLSELRAAKPDDVSARQKLMDTDYMVGGLAVVLGVAFAVLSHDMTALVVMLIIFGLVSTWHHAVLGADSR
jgi:hypothetical protein